MPANCSAEVAEISTEKSWRIRYNLTKHRRIIHTNPILKTNGFLSTSRQIPVREGESRDKIQSTCMVRNIVVRLLPQINSQQFWDVGITLITARKKVTWSLSGQWNAKSLTSIKSFCRSSPRSLVATANVFVYVCISSHPCPPVSVSPSPQTRTPFKNKNQRASIPTRRNLMLITNVG